MTQLRAVYPAIALAAFCAACGSTTADNANTVGGSPSPDGADSQAAQQSAFAADDAGASDAGTASHGAAFFALQQLSAWPQRPIASGDFNSTVTLGGCTANLVGHVQDSNGSVTIDGNTTFTAGNCRWKRKIDGTEDVLATFSDVANDYNRTVQVTDNLTETWADGSTTNIASLDPTAGYTYSYAASGRPLDGNTHLQVTLNEHRVRHAANGNVVFDHNITTPTPIEINNTFTLNGLIPVPANRTIVSGNIDIHHNLLHFNASHAFANVIHDLTGNCLCPAGGTIVQTVTKDGGGGFTRTYTFTSCGTLNVVTSDSTLVGTQNGNATLTWSQCQGS